VQGNQEQYEITKRVGKGKVCSHHVPPSSHRPRLFLD
jgi:hypothetical protein